MSLNVRVPRPGDGFEVPDQGSHTAALVAVIDLGTQERILPDGKQEAKHKVYFAYELVEAEKSDGTPFVIGREYTLSLADRAALRDVVKALRGGKDLQPEEEVDLRSLLGRHCIVAISHQESKTQPGRIFARLGGVQPPLRGMRVSPPRHTLVYWELSQEPIPGLDWLPYLYGQPLDVVVTQSREMRTQANGQALRQEAAEAF